MVTDSNNFASYYFDMREVPVMSRNLYVGADPFPLVSAVIGGDPNQITQATTDFWQEVQDTNFPERAIAIAEEIKNFNPLLIGLQEVSLFRTGDAGDSNPSEHIEDDYLQILLDELEYRGLYYNPVAVTENFDIEGTVDLAPNVQGDEFDLRLTDYDVILARSDIPESQISLSNVQEENFASSVVFGDGAIELVRGWNSVDVEIVGLEQEFRFINSHLEAIPTIPELSDYFKWVQTSQATELMNGPANTELSVILVGDYNSPADGQNQESYNILESAGFKDLWNEISPEYPGYTYGNEPDLLNEVPLVFDPQRIDLLMYRGDLRGDTMGRIGDEPDDRTLSGLWPSDHAGIVGTFGVSLATAKETFIRAPAKLNLKSQSNGLTHVNIITTDDFDATTIHPETLKINDALYGGGIQVKKWKTTDLDGDGDIDLKAFFGMRDLRESGRFQPGEDLFVNGLYGPNYLPFVATDHSGATEIVIYSNQE